MNIGLHAQQNRIPIPTPAQLQWQNAELAALVCWDLHAFDGELYVQSEAWIIPVEDYSIFNPQKYDMDQWFGSMMELPKTGLKYLIEMDYNDIFLKHTLK